MSRAFVVGIASVLCLAFVAACNTNDPVYVPALMLLESDGQMNTGAGGATTFGVKGTVALKLRASTDAEKAEREALKAKLNYDVPQVREDRFHVEVRYTVTNVSDTEGTFTVHVDGANEFTRYDEDVVAAQFSDAGQDPEFFGLIEPTPQTLAPGAVYQGIVREDDFHEAALDLDALGRYMAPFLAVLMNRSEVNPIGLEMVPPALIRPAIWEVTLQFSATQRMTCQFLVRVRDDDNRLWEDGSAVFVPDNDKLPATFTPVIPKR